MRSSYHLRILIILASLLTVSCGPKKVVETYEGPNYREIIPFEFLESALSNTELDCGEKGCEPTVGYFVSIDQFGEEQNRVKQCSSWLVKSNIAVTNKHCLSKIVLNDQEQCGRYMGVVFPAYAEYPQQTRVCKKILLMSNDPRNRPMDYVFYEIEDTKRKPLPISRKALVDEQAVEIWKFKAVLHPTKLKAQFEKTSCTLNMNSIINNSFTHGFAKQGMAFGCVTRSGHSGSPVVAVGKEPIVVGLHKGKTFKPDNWMGFVKSYNRIEFLKNQKQFHEYSNFNNMACVPLPFDKKISPLCSHTVRPLPVFKPKKHEAQMSELIAEWLQAIQVDFQFELEKKDKKNILKVVARPNCYNPKKTWLNDKNLSTNKKFLGSKGWHQMQVDMVLKFRKVSGLDERFRFLGEILRRRSVTQTLYIKENKGDTVQVIVQRNKKKREFKLKPCDVGKVEFKKIEPEEKTSDVPIEEKDQN